MLHRIHRHVFGRRMAAASASALVLGLGLTAATASVAQADPAGADSHLSVTWAAPVLTTDANGNGRPDLGDVVTISADFTALDGAVIVASASADNLVWLPATRIRSGDTKTLSRSFVVLPSQLQGVGSTGPVLTNFTVMYTQGFNGYSLPIASPAVLYTAPEPLTVSTTMNITEVGGSVPGAVVQGDSVGYTTTLTNTTPRPMTITSMPGYSDFPGSATISAGGTATFHHSPVTVTYADMVAGSVNFADAPIDWTAAYNLPGAQVFTGSVTATYPSTPAEAPNVTVDASATYTVNSATDGTRRALGEAVAGDLINIKYDASNQGNVSMNLVSLNWFIGTGGQGYTEVAAAFAPGTSLPNGIVKPKHLKSGGNGVFSPYVLTDEDIARGYVDSQAVIQVAPDYATLLNHTADFTKTLNERIYLKKFTLKANLAVTATLNDGNGDGIGQAGETVEFRVRLANNSNQNLAINDVVDLPGSTVAGMAEHKLEAATIAPDDRKAKRWTYTITDADVAAGSIVYGAQVLFTGAVTGEAGERSELAPTIATGVYVAPSRSLDTQVTYVDANGDGHPSIGETATFTVTVGNVGSYPLTGVAVTDGSPTDVAGLLPAFPTTVAPGASTSQTFTYVITAADFQRGSVGYQASLLATGMDVPLTEGATLGGITFQYYASDLDAVAAGGIGVCTVDGTPTDTVTHGTTFKVMPGDCTFGGTPTGYTSVIFSTPQVLAVGAFSAKLPVGLPVGAHRIALYAPNGSLVGWRNVTVKDPVVFSGGDSKGGVLAYTGADARTVRGALAGATLLVLLGTAAVVESGRRRRQR